MIIDFKKLIRSFRHAGMGLKLIFRQEQNFRIHIIAALLVLLLALIVKIAVWQLIVLILVIFFVLALEIINTVIEKLVDISTPRLHHYAAIIKDLMAAAVFMAAGAAVVIFVLIFWPYAANVITGLHG